MTGGMTSEKPLFTRGSWKVVNRPQSTFLDQDIIHYFSWKRRAHPFFFSHAKSDFFCYRKFFSDFLRLKSDNPLLISRKLDKQRVFPKNEVRSLTKPTVSNTLLP